VLASLRLSRCLLGPYKYSCYITQLTSHEPVHTVHIMTLLHHDPPPQSELPAQIITSLTCQLC
jgi:hypothetical protein